ncbi:MAG TPA: S1 RNA-binding domain-containing protein [Spirochaetota bacterium]|nr:S1 RNA-binding domain-containing protein [Spirochaetota bacterium]HPQ53276.1 S1 RNA-binding domain-containing protein [Spirochaetota bacterium]
MDKTRENDFSNEDFEKMLEESLVKSDSFEVGDRVQGTVVLITQDSILIDISGKSEAVIDRTEFIDGNDEITVKRGDTIDAIVAALSGGEIRLTTKIGMGFLNRELVEKAYQEQLPVTGTVTGQVKGGYRVSISGITAFCPISQTGFQSPDNPEELINQSFEFMILEYREGGRNIIVSRRTYLEQKREQRLSEILTTVHVGDSIHGTVQSIQGFGVIVDLDGVEGMVPRSEISWSRSNDLSMFKKGDPVTAKIIAIDENRRILLSIKQLSPEPWDNAGKYQKGQTLNGRITNTIKNGAFVELEPGLEGFIPVSKLSLLKRVANVEDVVRTGDMVNVRILDININDKKMLLELVTNEADPWELPTEELTSTVHTAIIEGNRNNGLTLRLSNGMLGFLPKGELLSSRGDTQSQYQTGNEIKVMVKDIDKNDKKLILSERRAEKNKEMKEYEEYNQQQDSPGASTLGSLFKDKFSEINRNIKK